MAIEINWVEQHNKGESYAEIPLLGGNLCVYYFENIINKTEWKIEKQENVSEISNQWVIIQQYLNNPCDQLTINLKKQGSDFRNKVWQEIYKIPIGQTMSYSALSNKIDSGARAVANACRDNPFPGIIPCHRVVAVSGIGGFMGQTEGRCLELKRKILAVEAVFSKGS